MKTVGAAYYVCKAFSGNTCHPANFPHIHLARTAGVVYNGVTMDDPKRYEVLSWGVRQPVILNLQTKHGNPIIETLTSGRKLIPFGQRKADGVFADTHLAQARCQNAGPAFWG